MPRIRVNTVKEGNKSLSAQLPQNFFSQLLCLAKELLVLDEEAVQLQRFVRREMLAQHHVTHMHRVGQGCVFGQFFQRGFGIVMVHAAIVALPRYSRRDAWATPFLFPINRAGE